MWDAGGEALLMLNSQGAHARVPTLAAGEALSVRFRFDCPLPAGRYRLGAGVHSPGGGGFLDRRMNWRTLDVVSAQPARSLVDIPYEVSFESSPAAGDP